MRIRLDLAWDGTDFAGWQLQPGRRTVQGEVEESLRRLYRLGPGERLPVVASGRTDAGVHAERQVAHFDAPRRIPPDGIRDGANGLLPAASRVRAARAAAPGFHARRDAARKTYRYHLLTAFPASPLETRFAWAVGRPLDRETLSSAAARFAGRHDFRAFFAAPPGEEPESPFREVSEARILGEGPRFVFSVTADGFFRYMVRRMVGTLVLVGTGQLPPGRIAAMLADPALPGPRPRAPAAGLRLHRVWYPGEDRASGPPLPAAAREGFGAGGD